MKINKQVICFDIKGNKHQVSSNKLTFRPSVYGVAVQNGKVLIQKNWDGYNFPGGKVELGESLNKALKREFIEETGLKIKIIKTLSCEDSFFFLPFEEKPVHSILIYYLCKIESGEITTDNFDKFEKQYAEKAEWVDLKKAERVKFCGSIKGREIIKKYISISK